LCLRLAGCALQSQHDLLRSLRLLVEHGLRLTTITGLFAIITTLSLREQRRLFLLDADRSRGLFSVPFRPYIGSPCAVCAFCSPCPYSRCVLSLGR
jgi:hypothetical protein